MYLFFLKDNPTALSPLGGPRCPHKKKKKKSLQKRPLRFLYEDYVSSYEELLQKAGKKTMKINRLRSLCIEICKSINNINPMYIR